MLSAMMEPEIVLRENASAVQALEIVMAHCLDHLADNASQVKASKPDALHQVRVAVRRLHAAVKLFSAILPRPATAHIFKELKWVRRETSAAREFDVFLEEFLVPLMKQQQGADVAMVALHRRCLAQRRQAYRAAETALRSTRFQDLLASITKSVKTEMVRGRSQRWRDHRRPARELVEPVLATLTTKMTDAGQLKKMDAHQLHKLRLRAKRMRYTIELVTSLYAGDQNRKRITAMLAALGRLQSALGDINDLHARQAILERAKSGKTAGSIVAKLIDRDSDRRLAKFLTKAVEGYDRFRRIELFWT